MRAVAADTYQKPMNSCAVQLANQILENSICNYTSHAGKYGEL